MTLESEKPDLEWVADALQAISKEMSYAGLAKVLLKVALGYSRAVRGAVLLSEGGELLAKADACFPREKAKVSVSYPPVDEFRLSDDLNERVIKQHQTVVGRYGRSASPLINKSESRAGPDVTILCLPLIHQQQVTGVLYLESEGRHEPFMSRSIAVISMLATQAAVSFQSAQLFEALRETNMWMVKGQQIGRMGSYRWNTRTLLSRASRECYRILDVDVDINPVPFEVFLNRIHPDDLSGLERALAEAVRTQSPFTHEYRICHRDQTILHVIAVGQFDLSPSGDVELEGIITDVTDRKAAEQALADAQSELAQATRLASLGELAGSIIHEINQPLASIAMSAEACVRWLARDPIEPGEASKSAIRVIEQAHRASNVVGGLKSLIRNASPQFSTIKINEVAEEVLLLSKRDCERANVTIITELDASIQKIEADRMQIQQVIANLVRNAIDAMKSIDTRARILTVSSKVTSSCVSVAIADTGVGIDGASSDRLFDALYTTKKEGLGLGLSISRKIVGAHGGRLCAEKNTPYGAKFTFTLPLRQVAQVNGNK